MASQTIITLDALQVALDLAKRDGCTGSVERSSKPPAGMVSSGAEGANYVYQYYARRAERFRLAKQYNQSLADCDKILERCSWSLDALCTRGLVLFDMCRFREAIQAFDLVLERYYDESILFYRQLADHISWSKEPVDFLKASTRQGERKREPRVDENSIFSSVGSLNPAVNCGGSPRVSKIPQLVLGEPGTSW